MSATTASRMTISSSFMPLARIGHAIDVWRHRAWDRANLSRLEDRDLHDLGLSRAAANYEADKPFWRA